MRIYLGFEYRDGFHTTTGQPNKKTGRLNIAGELKAFHSIEAREMWIYDLSWKRVACNKSTGRQFFQGDTVKEYCERIDNAIRELEHHDH